MELVCQGASSSGNVSGAYKYKQKDNTTTSQGDTAQPAFIWTGHSTTSLHLKGGSTTGLHLQGPKHPDHLQMLQYACCQWRLLLKLQGLAATGGILLLQSQIFAILIDAGFSMIKRKDYGLKN